MTVFISEEGHIFQAVESGSPDRHIIYDGRLEWPGGSDTLCTFRRETKQFSWQTADLTQHSGVVNCAFVTPKMDRGSMSSGFQHDSSSTFLMKLRF